MRREDRSSIALFTLSQTSAAVLELTARMLGLQDDGAAFVEADQVKDIFPISMPMTAIWVLGLAALLCAGMGGSSVPVIPLCKRWEGNPRSIPLEV